MSTLYRGPTTRWILLVVLVVFVLYAWHRPSAYAWRRPSALTSPTADETFQFVPPKPYGFEPMQQDPTLISQSGTGERPGKIENPNTPSFPAFKSSSQLLPSNIYNPYPDYNSRAWKGRWKGSHATCLGPRGVDVNGNPGDMLIAHKFESADCLPQAMFGSYNETGLDSTFCFDRFTRYGPYGYDEDEQNQGPNTGPEKVDWTRVDWGGLQSDCFLRNINRYQPFDTTNRNVAFWMPTEEELANIDDATHFPQNSKKGWWSRREFKHRSGVVLRVKSEVEWSVDAVQYIRSLILELSLHTGAEYEIIILMEVKDDKKSIFTDPVEYAQVLRTSTHEEFLNQTVLFNKALLDSWYPKAKQSGANRQDSYWWQPLQLLSLLRPELEYFWQLEAPVRYTGHHYQHLETISAWSKSQPRRSMWERGSLTYIPAVHGDWANFSIAAEDAMTDGGVWGPVRVEGIEPVGPEPPVESPQLDNYEWGVEEEADLITTSPIVDLTGDEDDSSVLNYHPGAHQTPLRGSGLLMMTRTSKRLLRAMHHGQVSSGTYMSPELYAASTALHHGLKAVAFPLPIFLDFAKKAPEIENTFNQNSGKEIYTNSFNYEDIHHRMSYYSLVDQKDYFADELYKRWLGYGKDLNERLCLPGILLNPINGV